jgi:hypothetical protein
MEENMKDKKRFTREEVIEALRRAGDRMPVVDNEKDSFDEGIFQVALELGGDSLADEY